MSKFQALLLFMLPLVGFLVVGCSQESNEEVVTNKSGLQYVELKVGEGEEAQEGDLVDVKYTGWLKETKKEFDSTEKSGDTFEFHVGKAEVIRGWDEGVQGMKEGGKRKLIIPSKLGYGDRRNGIIPAGSDLLFEVELVKVTKVPKLDAPAKPTDVSKLTPTVTPTGLKYYDITEGEGEAVRAGNKVRVHYTGWLLDGTQFDSSLPKKAALEVPVGAGRVIQGWDEGLVGMKQGGKRQLIVPPELGYRNQKKGDIPPNSTLVFDVHMLKVK